MLIYAGVSVLLAIIAWVLLAINPESDRGRLEEARMQLQRLGYRLPRGSEEEIKAVRRVLEGRHPDFV